MEDVNLFDYAFCGAADVFAKTIANLAAIAEDENWSLDGRPNSVLYSYVKGTFRQCYMQGKVLVSDDGEYSCFNTGLLTKHGNDIVGLFTKNRNEGGQEWFLTAFRDISDRQFLNTFDCVPELATYTNNYEELYFNPNYPLILNIDHILDDNWDRIRDVVPMSKRVVHKLIESAVEDAKKQVRRNIRLVVPQYYNNKISYLLPLQIPLDDSDDTVVMALAIELTAKKQYRANTIFTKEMAYNSARLLMRPESNWLM